MLNKIRTFPNTVPRIWLDTYHTIDAKVFFFFFLLFSNSQENRGLAGHWPIWAGFVTH